MPATDDIYLLEARPFDATTSMALPGPPFPGAALPYPEALTISVTGAERLLYYATRAINTGPADTPASVAIEGRITDPLNFEARLYAGAEPGAGAVPGIGEIRLANADGGMDEALDLSWDGRSLRLLRGAPGDPVAEFEEVALLTCAGLSWDLETVSIRLRDLGELFQLPIASSYYAGTGGAEGGDDLKGQPKPQMYGTCFNVAPVLIDAANLVYQFHDRAAQSVSEVRDGGSALTLDGDSADYAALIAASISTGHCRTCLALGLIRLGGVSEFTITLDAEGDASGDGYVETTAQIVARIAQARGGFYWPDQFDVAAFTALDVASAGSDSVPGVPFPGGALGITDPLQFTVADALVATYLAPVGLYIDQPRAIASVLDELMGGIGGWWLFRIDGKLTVGVAAEPAAEPDAADFTFDAAKAEIRFDTGIVRQVAIPRFSTQIGWQKAWKVQAPEQLAGVVGAADQSLYGNEYRFEGINDIVQRVRHKTAREVFVPALFAQQSDAALEAARQAELFGVERSLVEIGVNLDPFADVYGRTVELRNIDRFGWGAAKRFRCIGATAEARTGRMTLILWG